MADTLNEDATATIGPEEGGGPPIGLPWTLIVDGEDWSADLEHGAPLPRIGDRIDYIADDGRQRRFRVREVVHTVQSSPDERPRVRDESSSPNSTVEGAGDRQPGSLRAGLPQVIVSPED
ncbi:MAG TPA: hypothetical protein VFW95_03205 [Candidatus Limnocylindria bacterium]|nr:hypothetical protein [Candidatus Limnocylindria bacterium]